MSKRERDRLLADLKSTAHGQTPGKAIEVLEAFGFVKGQRDGGIQPYIHPTETDLVVKIGIQGNNIPRPQRTATIRACEQIILREDAAKVELVEFTQAVFINECPEIRRYVTIKSAWSHEVRDKKIAEAVAELEIVVKQYAKQFEYKKANYGIKAIRDEEKHTLTLSALECNVQKKFDYATAEPMEVAAFVDEFVKEVEAVIERRDSLFIELTEELGAKIVADEPDQIRLTGPKRTGGKPIVLSRFGESGFLTADSERILNESIHAVQQRIEAEAERDSKTGSHETHSTPLKDGVISTSIIGSSKLPKAAMEAKHRLFDIAAHALGIQDQVGLLEAIQEPLKIRGTVPNDFFDPTHTMRPGAQPRDEITRLRKDFERLLREKLPEKRGKSTAIKNASHDFMTVANERSKVIGEDAVDRVAKTSRHVDNILR